MPFHSMTPAMRLANRPWVPRLPRGGKPAPGAPLPARSRARLPAQFVRFVRFVRFAGSHRSPPASRRRPGSSRPGPSRFASRSCVATQSSVAPARRASRDGRRARAQARETGSGAQSSCGRSRTESKLRPSRIRAGPERPRPPGRGPRGLVASARRAARGDAGAGRGALCGTPGTSRVIVRADGEGGLSSLRPGGQGANERW